MLEIVGVEWSKNPVYTSEVTIISVEIKEHYLDYPHDYPHDYAPDKK